MAENNDIFSTNPIETEGIKIGEKKFKIKSDLDLNRRKEIIADAEMDFTEKGVGSIARSPKVEEIIDYAVATKDGNIALGQGAVSIGLGSIALGDLAMSQGWKSNSISNINRNSAYWDIKSGWSFALVDPEELALLEYMQPYLLGEKLFYIEPKDHDIGSLNTLFSIRNIPFSLKDPNKIIPAWIANNFSKTLINKQYFLGMAYGNQSIAMNEGMAVGPGSVAKGKYSLAIGSNSFALGQNTTAQGIHSYAQGEYSTALGSHCHAEGFATIATELDSGYAGSHAEGWRTIARANSHAEGHLSGAMINSHAEGENTYANNYSHAEGQGTIANNYSHAEGTQTESKETSHAEGENTYANNRSHAEGIESQAENLSHAEGFYTYANNRSHVEGCYNKAYGQYSSAKGSYCVTGNKENGYWEKDEETGSSLWRTTGKQCSVSGYDSLAFANNTSVHGRSLISNYENQFIIGQYNKNYKDSLFEVGNGIDKNSGAIVRNYNDYKDEKSIKVISPDEDKNVYQTAFRVTKSGIAIVQEDIQLEDGTSLKKIASGGADTGLPNPTINNSFLYSENGVWVEKNFKETILSILNNAEETSY